MDHRCLRSVVMALLRMPRFTIMPDIEAILTIEPSLRGSMTFPSAWQDRNTTGRINIEHSLPLGQRHLFGGRRVRDSSAVGRNG